MMNRAAVALVGQESRLPQEWLTTSWNETQVYVSGSKELGRDGGIMYFVCRTK